MGKIFDFLHSRTFMTHMTALLSIVGVNYAVPQSTYASLGIAILTAFTQGSHAYQTVKLQQTITIEDVKKALAEHDNGKL